MAIFGENPKKDGKMSQRTFCWPKLAKKKFQKKAIFGENPWVNLF